MGGEERGGGGVFGASSMILERYNKGSRTNVSEIVRSSAAAKFRCGRAEQRHEMRLRILSRATESVHWAHDSFALLFLLKDSGRCNVG